MIRKLFLAKISRGDEEKHKKAQLDEIYNQISSQKPSSSESRKSIRNDEKLDFLTENETFPNRSLVVQGHSGDAYGPGNARYDAL